MRCLVWRWSRRRPATLPLCSSSNVHLRFKRLVFGGCTSGSMRGLGCEPRAVRWSLAPIFIHSGSGSCVYAVSCIGARSIPYMLYYDHTVIVVQNFDFLKLFPNIWTLSPLQRKYYHSSYCNFVLHSDLETCPCS